MKYEDAAFDFIQFCKQLSNGMLWGVQLKFPAGESFLLYDFANSLALLCDTNATMMKYQEQRTLSVI